MKKESSIQQISNKIRDFLHGSTIAKTKIFLDKDKGYWNQLWSSLDTIKDTEIAVGSFVQIRSEVFQKSPYITTYGLLQALYIQQDAISHLKESIFAAKIDWEKEYPEIYLIRDVRNLTIGHPTKNNRKKFKRYTIFLRG